MDRFPNNPQSAINSLFLPLISHIQSDRIYPINTPYIIIILQFSALYFTTTIINIITKKAMYIKTIIVRTVIIITITITTTTTGY